MKSYTELFKSQCLPTKPSSMIRAWNEVESKGIMVPEVYTYLSNNKKTMTYEEMANDPLKPRQLRGVTSKQLRSYVEVISLFFNYVDMLRAAPKSHKVTIDITKENTTVLKAQEFLGYNIEVPPLGYAHILSIEPLVIKDIFHKERTFKSITKLLHRLGITREVYGYGYYVIDKTAPLRTCLNPDKQWRVYFKNGDADKVRAYIEMKYNAMQTADMIRSQSRRGDGRADR